MLEEHLTTGSVSGIGGVSPLRHATDPHETDPVEDENMLQASWAVELKR